MKWLLPTFFLLLASTASAQGISQLQQFTSTTSPSSAITQSVWGKAFRLSGQAAGCAQFSANGTLTSTGTNCGSGSGSLASSTLLADTNTWSGNNTFNNAITGSITGNAATVTNGVYTTTFNALSDARFITDLAATTSVKSVSTLPSLSLPYSQLTGTPVIASSTLLSDSNTFSGTLNKFSNAPAVGISGLLKGNGSSAITAASNGTDFTLITAKSCNAGDFILSVTAAGVFNCGTPAGTTYTGTFPISVSGSVISSLFSTTTNTGMSAGNLYVGSGGIFQTAASSSIFGYTPLNPTRALTINGTANQVSSSAGSQDLSVDRTWTLSLPSLIVNPAASTTLFSNFSNAYFGGTATTTIDGTGNIVIPSGSGLTITGKTDGCATFATGVLNSTGTACGSGGGGAAYPFTPSTDGGISTSATTTPLQFSGSGLGLDVSNTAWFGIGGKLFGYASSTNWGTVLGLGAGGQNSTTSATSVGLSAFGYQAGSAITTGAQNTALGAFSMSNISASTSPQNTAVGYGALWGNTTAITSALTGQNTAVGYLALASTTSANTNTAVGYQAGVKVTSGISNVLIGNQTGSSLTSTSNNVAVGYQALNNVNNNNNVAIGFQSTQSSAGASAGQNVSIGAQSIGQGTFNPATSITGETAIGYNSLLALTTGLHNTAIGHNAGSNITSGYDNIVIGQVENTGGSNLTTGGGNILMGYNPLPPAVSTKSFLNVGGLIFGTLPATSSATTLQTPTSGLLGVSTTSPFAKFSIHANNGDTAQTLFAIGSSTLTATTTLFSIDNQGNLTQSGPSTGSATKGTCFKTKNANANSFTYWYFPTAGAAPTYQTADCGGAGTTTITYQ